jgi:hypothetical protein
VLRQLYLLIPFDKVNFIEECQILKLQTSFFLILILSFFTTHCAPNPSGLINEKNNIDGELRKTLTTKGVQPLEKPATSPASVELGRMLFWDKILCDYH